MEKEIAEYYNYEEMIEAKEDRDGWGYCIVKYERGFYEEDEFQVFIEYREFNEFSEYYKTLDKIFSTYEEAEKYAIEYFNTEMNHLKI